ncbi:hypothetical protein Q0Z83_045810 [Actinoplanes sichuanensis]|uniref:DUF1152 domain-containing protein n=1 Tax=Actinoplanes sichuanensis TaxID=512349 RepID=A0ABW4A989_9ACTN|nr:DUF1152 domain-containing protein [Actinoplanes sichuanensis]BEL06390.1 hypothetical protein Q0Z83_045810 [Actinoplanes sichuanensis]
MGTLLVAAGGGGDVIAAAALSALTSDEAVGIATMAWDRLIIDPLPGPRGAADFTGLETRRGWRQVTTHTRPIPPAGSTLPRLAGEIPFPLILLDPTRGAHGMRQQIQDAATELGADHLRLVDVGGDLLGRPGDVGLRSPFADALTAAGCLALPSSAWIAGPGLDGELIEDVVCERARDHVTVHTLVPELWKPYLPILDWHPTEATALLACATLGLRGTVEIRDAGLPVHLTDRSPTVLELDLATVADINPLVRLLATSESMFDAERLAVEVMGSTELQAERAKAAKRRRHRSASADTLAVLPEWEREARRRNIDFVTYRRLAEALGFTEVAALRALLAAHIPAREAGLLWKVRPEPTID